MGIMSEQEEYEDMEEYEDDYDFDALIGLQRTQATVLIVIVCISSLSNIAVLFLIFTSSRSSRYSTRVRKQLMIHLCVGDFTYAMFTILPRTINILTFPRFYGGYFVCRFVKFLQLIPVYSCPFLMVVCSIERYANIGRAGLDDDPLSAANRRRISWRESRSFVHVLSFWAWLTAMVLSAPNILAFRYEYLDEAGTIGACTYQIRESYERLWMTFLTFATWLIPLLILLLLFSLAILRYLSKSVEHGKYSCPLSARRTNERTEQLTLLKFLLVIIFIKFALWTPFNVTNIVGSYLRSIEIGENLSVSVTLACNCACFVPAIGYILFDIRAIYQRIRDAWVAARLRKLERRGQTIQTDNVKCDTAAFRPIQTDTGPYEHLEQC